MGLLSEFLDEVTPKADAEPVAETPTADAAPATGQTGETTAQPATETATAATAGTAPNADAPPASGQDNSPLVPRAALEDERTKRKDWKAKAIRAEERLEMLMKQQFQPPQAGHPQATPQPQIQRPDPLTDPEGYDRHIQTQFQAHTTISRREISEQILVSSKPDANETLAEFANIARANPALIQALDQQANPAQWAYDFVKHQKALREIGPDPEAWKKQQLETLKAQWLAESQAAASATPAAQTPAPNPAASIPQSLATARNAGARTGPAASAPSFDEAFARKY